MLARIYLVLAVLGFLAPLFPMLKVSLETGNLLLWTHPTETVAGLFDNDISTAFGIDLLWAVGVFSIWVFAEAARVGVRRPWLFIVLTLIFGVAGPFPLFLYVRELALGRG
jgi:hypothetical protein